MNSVSLIIAILLAAAVLAYMYAKRRGIDIGSLILGPPSVDKLKNANAKEMEAQERLRALLAAKKKLVQTKAANAKLRKEIEQLNEANVDTKPTVFPSTHLKH